MILCRLVTWVLMDLEFSWYINSIKNGGFLSFFFFGWIRFQNLVFGVIIWLWYFVRIFILLPGIWYWDQFWDGYLFIFAWDQILSSFLHDIKFIFLWMFILFGLASDSSVSTWIFISFQLDIRCWVQFYMDVHFFWLG